MSFSHCGDLRQFDVQKKEIHMSSFKYKDKLQIQRNYSPLFHTKLVHLATLISLHFFEELALLWDYCIKLNGLNLHIIATAAIVLLKCTVTDLFLCFLERNLNPIRSSTKQLYHFCGLNHSDHRLEEWDEGGS